MIGDKLRERAGFTVVELIIAVGLFTVIISVSVGAYIRVLKMQSFMTSVMAANDNVSLVLEQLAREIRTGDEFEGRGEVLSFKNETGTCVRYALGGEAILKATKEEGSCADGQGYGGGEALTSRDVSITKLNFTHSPDYSVSRDITFDKIDITVGVNIADINKAGSFFKNSGNELKTTVSARKYF